MCVHTNTHTHRHTRACMDTNPFIDLCLGYWCAHTHTHTLKYVFKTLYSWTVLKICWLAAYVSSQGPTLHHFTFKASQLHGNMTLIHGNTTLLHGNGWKVRALSPPLRCNIPRSKKVMDRTKYEQIRKISVCMCVCKCSQS